MIKRSAIGAWGHKFRTRNISKRVQRIVISPIKEMSILADQLATSNKRQETRNKKIISFGQGIPYFDTPFYIKRGIQNALEETDTAKYTLEPGITELRELIAKDLEKRKGIKRIKAKKEIMVGTGCQEAMACAIAAIIDPKDEVLLPSAGFASHIEQVLQFNGKPIFFPLIEQQGWKPDLKKLEQRITRKTKAIIFSNPSNPTGSVLSKKEVEALAKIAKNRDLIIITDETYDFLTYDGIKHISPASIPALRDRVILCGSFSKKFAMTGYRVGYAFADSGIIDHMLKVHDALTICAPAISQKAVIAALRQVKESEKSVSGFVKKLAQNRELVCNKLDKLKNIFEYQKPKGAYYILARYKIPKINSFDLAIKIMKEARVIVVPGAAFGPGGENHLRFSFACSSQEIKEGFSRLAKWAEKLKNKI